MGLCFSKCRSSFFRSAVAPITTTTTTTANANPYELSSFENAEHFAIPLDNIDASYERRTNVDVTEAAQHLSHAELMHPRLVSRIPGPVYIIDEKLISLVPINLWQENKLAQCVYPKVIEAFSNILRMERCAVIFILTNHPNKIRYIKKLLSLQGPSYADGIRYIKKNSWRNTLREIAEDDTQTIPLCYYIKTNFFNNRVVYIFPEGNNLNITKNFPTDRELPEERSIKFHMLTVELPSDFDSHKYTIPIDYAFPGYKFYLEDYLPKRSFSQASFSSSSEESCEEEQEVMRKTMESVEEILYEKIVNILECEEKQLLAALAKNSEGKFLIIQAIKTALQKQREWDEQHFVGSPLPGQSSML